MSGEVIDSSDPFDRLDWPDDLAENRNVVDDLTVVLKNHVDELDEAVGKWTEFEGTVEELASGLFDLQVQRKRIAQIEATIEASLARVMPVNEMQSGKYKLKRAYGLQRKNWDHDRVAGRLVNEALERSGGDLEQAVWLFRDLMLQAASPSWRTTVLRSLDVDFDDCCEVERKRRSVQVVVVDDA